MRRIAYALWGALIFGMAGNAQALVVDCNVPGGCRVDKYGLSAPDSYGKEPDPIFEVVNPLITPMGRDFGGSYAFQKDTSSPTNPQCDGEGGFVPVFGQVLLREQVNCVPTDTVGCPVEMATDLNPPATQTGSPTETWFADSRLIFVNAQLGPGFFVQMFISTASHGRIHGFGQRFRIGAGPQTRIHWDRIGTDSRLGDPTTTADDFTRGDSRSKVCCNFSGGFNLCGASSLDVYPIITDTQALGSVQKNVPDWIFEGGPGTNWQTDPDFVAPGQQHGVCSGAGFPDDVSRLHRRVGCDIDPCPSRGMTCQGPVGNQTCNGVPANQGGILCNTVDECNLDAAGTCNQATGFCNSPPHINTEIPCETNADCDLNDVCDLREGGYRLFRGSTTPPPTSDAAAIGSCANNTAISCTQGNCTPASNPACECAVAGVGGECALARVPEPLLCGQALFYFRGFANENCSVVGAFLNMDVCEALAGPGQEAGCIVPTGVVGRRRGICGLRAAGSTGAFTPVVPAVECELDGDPGSDCSGRNYGAFIRPDLNCDGTDDVPNDLCPNYNETDPFSDENGDGRGDECQCGDATPPTVGFVAGQYTRDRDGFVNVSDLVATNFLIFNDPAAGTGADGRYRVSAPTCDSTGDDRCNVSDIVGTNLEIFSPGYTARCFRFPCPEPLTSCTSSGGPLP